MIDQPNQQTGIEVTLPKIKVLLESAPASFKAYILKLKQRGGGSAVIFPLRCEPKRPFYPFSPCYGYLHVIKHSPDSMHFCHTYTPDHVNHSCMYVVFLSFCPTEEDKKI